MSVCNCSTSGKGAMNTRLKDVTTYAAACRPANSKVNDKAPLSSMLPLGDFQRCRWFYSPCRPRLGLGNPEPQCHAGRRLARRRVDPSRNARHPKLRIELLRDSHSKRSASVHWLGIQGVLSSGRVFRPVLHDGKSMTGKFFHQLQDRCRNGRPVTRGTTRPPNEAT